MKHLLTIISCFVVLSMSAQSNFIEFPYNPDSDNDDLIGTEDLLTLLSLYGSAFSEEALYVNDEGTFATMHLGKMNYAECIKACFELPGNWVMTSFEDAAKAGPEAFELTVNGPNEGVFLRYDRPLEQLTQIVQAQNNWEVFTLEADGRVHTNHMVTEYECGCAIHERPKIEFYTCTATCSEGVGALDECVNEKAMEGWYPLNQGQHGVYANCFWQPMWRLVE